MKILRDLTIRQKLILAIGTGTLVTIIVTSTMILLHVSSLLEKELIHKGTIVAASLSKQCIEPILHDDMWGIYKSIKTLTDTAHMPFLEYIIVLDKGGRILAHSHPRHFRVGDPLPEGPFNEKALHSKETAVQVAAVSKNESLYDIAAPCSIGSDKIGTVRVGLSDKPLRRELTVVKKNVFLIILLFSVIGIAVSIVMAYHITGPLKRVTNNILKISQGRIREVFPIEQASKDEVGRMVVIFNEMAKNLKTQIEMDEYLARKEKLAMLGEFSAGVAHEIKNPLTSIKMLMQSTVEKNETLSTKDMEMIEGEINRIDRIVKDFLTFARPAQTAYARTDVNEILGEVIMLTRPEIERSRIELINEFADQVPEVVASPDDIKQVILNIVLNAIQAMEKGGRLRITSSAHDGTVSIRVSDSGPGISEEDLKHVFDPFFTTKKDGTGMGLAIVDRIVREYGGHVRIHTEAGKGTEVVIGLPA